MSNRVITVTGANGALGKAIAQRFLNGCAQDFVYLGVHNRREAAEELVSRFPHRCACISLDVTRPEAWKAAVDEISQAHGRIDVLVNNAGMHSDALLATMPHTEWSKVIQTNLDATFYGCQAVVKTMMAQRSGRIINIASLSALMAPAGQANYAAAKAGVVALTSSLAKEVARSNITVNALCPGYIDTEALASMSTDEKQAAARRVPMRRFGKPDEVAAAVEFLACAQAAYITGSVLKIDGGIF